MRMDSICKSFGIFKMFENHCHVEIRACVYKLEFPNKFDIFFVNLESFFLFEKMSTRKKLKICLLVNRDSYYCIGSI